MAPTEQSSPAASADSRDDRYVVVARRYRPRSFEELVGQEHIGQALCNAIETGRVGHAYLFTGARGVGKTSTARIFAKALNDPSGPTAHPGAGTDIAQAIDAGEDVDVLEIDGASNRGIDEIRSLRAGVGVRPSRSRYKIYIIDEVHMLTGAAFNALLKTLEEPPPHVKFIFCTTDPEKIPITVLSRCQRFDFAPVQTESILGRLREIVDAEQVKADDEALRLIARRAEGSMRDSQSLLEQVMSFSSGELTLQSVHAMLGTAEDARLHELGKTIATGDAAAALALVDRACSEGIAAGQLTEQLLGYFRDVLTTTVGCPAQMQRHTGESLHEELRALGQQWGLQTVLGMVAMIDQTLTRIRHSLHGRVLLEATIVQLCHLPNLQQVADLAATLGASCGAAPSGPAAATARGQEKKNVEPVIGSPVALRETTIHAGQTAAMRGPIALPPQQTLGASAVSGPVAMSMQGGAGVATSVGVATAAPARTAVGAGAVGPGALGQGAVGQGAVGGAIAGGGVQVTGSHENAASAHGSAVSGHAASLRQAGHGGASAVGGGARNGQAQVAEAGPERLAAPAKSRAQRMREIENHPYVKTCLEIFGAEIIRIDPPRS